MKSAFLQQSLLIILPPFDPLPHNYNIYHCPYMFMLTSKIARSVQISGRRKFTMSPTLSLPSWKSLYFRESQQIPLVLSAQNHLGTHFNFKVSINFLQVPKEMSGKETDRTLEVDKFFLYKVIKLLKFHGVLFQEQTCLCELDQKDVTFKSPLITI